MYYNDYEDYMRNVLGYNNANDNTYGCNCGYDMNDMYLYTNRNNPNTNSNIEQMYPEIYKIINPMVCRMCDNNMQPVSEYLIEQMTDDIYDNVVNRVEIQNVINLNIGTREAEAEINVNREENNRSNSSTLNSQNRVVSSSANSSNSSGSSNNNVAIKSKEIKDVEERETRSPIPRRRNRLLRDLIRILILNRLIRPGRPNRPPFRPGPGSPRPPFPNRPGMGPRPPFPRTENDYMSNDYIPYM